MNIGPLKVGGNEPCAIVAEIGNAHNGRFSRAIELINAAKECGASAAKLQCYTAGELVQLRGDGPAPEPWGSQGWTMRTLYEKAATPLAWFPDLFGFARHIGLPLFSSVFGDESFALLESLDNPAYKIASLDAKSGLLDRVLAKTGKPVIVSVVEFPQTAPPPGVFLLHCPPGYPQADIRLSTLRDKLRVLDDGRLQRACLGFSYHGTKIDPPVLAVAAGAKMVEVHFQLDDAPSELEANVSLGERQFARMVRAIRRVETML